MSSPRGGSTQADKGNNRANQGNNRAAVVGRARPDPAPGADRRGHGDPGVLSGARLRRWRWVMLAVAVVGYALDQATKALAEARLDPYDPPRYLGGLLTLRLVHNPGAAFSLGSGATVAISVFAVVALLVVIVWVAPRVHHRWSTVACGMIMAGIAGNLTDRLVRPPGPLRGHVVDFVSLPHFAVFNVADVFITATAVLVVAVSVLGGQRRGEEASGPDEEATS